MTDYKHVTKLGDVNNGAADEIFARELRKVIDNVMDASTDATAKRTITLTVELTPTEDRETMGVTVKSKVSLAPVRDDRGSMRLSLDDDGKVVATVKDKDPKQQEFNLLIKEAR